MIFQLTQEDIDRSSTLTKRDLGKWCYVSNGCIMGYHKTREAAEQQYAGAIPYRKPETPYQEWSKEPGWRLVDESKCDQCGEKQGNRIMLASINDCDQEEWVTICDDCYSECLTCECGINQMVSEDIAIWFITPIIQVSGDRVTADSLYPDKFVCNKHIEQWLLDNGYTKLERIGYSLFVGNDEDDN